MDNANIRVDSPSARLSYPSERDKKGYARLSLKSKRYHFGRYGTPESYATFALWSAELARTGEAPEIASIKPHVRDFLSGQPSGQPAYTKKWFAGGLVSAALVLGLCAIFAGYLASRIKPPQVDGIAMSQTEILRIRNTRLVDAQRDARRASFDAIATKAVLLEKLEREGSASLPLPKLPDDVRRLAKPPLPDVSSRSGPGGLPSVDDPAGGSSQRE